MSGKMTISQLYRLFLEHRKVITDSRRIEKGCLFFALKGENFNGNSFAVEALNKGAEYAVIDEKEFSDSNRTILVDDVLTTLQQLAAYHRRELGIPVIGITGSNGKTTTKELVAAVLSESYKIIFTEGNLNNHIGVPLTLLNMDHSTQIGIIEMGANHEGEINALCDIADPDFGIITNIGIAHLEGFGSLETIKKTKAELYQHLKQKEGLIFYNSDNQILSEISEGIASKISYGKKNADLTGEIIAVAPFLNVKINFPQKPVEIGSRLIGSYNFENILAAACIGNYFNVAPPAIKEAISNYTPKNNRSQLIERNGLKIVMDAYNANPSSMKASIESFVSVFDSSRYLILGDMLELGENAVKEHIAVLKAVHDAGFNQVYLIGPVFHQAAKGFPFNSFANVNEFLLYLQQHSIEQGAVLIKGSRGIHLEKVLDSL